MQQNTRGEGERLSEMGQRNSGYNYMFLVYENYCNLWMKD